MAFTFTTLKSAIQDYTQNTETTFTANLARFILNAEERILKEAELSDFRKNSTGKTASSVKYLSKPSDFLAPFRQMNFCCTSTLLLFKTSHQIRLQQGYPSIMQIGMRLLFLWVQLQMLY